MTKKYFSIYHTRLHLLVTFLFVVAPVVFLFSFAHFAQIPTSTLFFDFIVSFSRLVIAYFFAVLLAWVFALFFYHGKRSTVAIPLFDVLQSLPTFAILPLATLFWGPSETTIIFFLVITIIWPILFSTLSSLRLIKTEWEEVVQIYGLSGFNYLRYFLIPISIPGIITGSIIGLGEGWEALVGTEIIVRAPQGLGPFFQGHSTEPLITGLGIAGLLLLIFSINRLLWLPLLEKTHKKMED